MAFGYPLAKACKCHHMRSQCRGFRGGCTIQKESAPPRRVVIYPRREWGYFMLIFYQAHTMTHDDQTAISRGIIAPRTCRGVHDPTRKPNKTQVKQILTLMETRFEKQMAYFVQKQQFPHFVPIDKVILLVVVYRHG